MMLRFKKLNSPKNRDPAWECAIAVSLCTSWVSKAVRHNGLIADLFRLAVAKPQPIPGQCRSADFFTGH